MWKRDFEQDKWIMKEEFWYHHDHGYVMNYLSHRVNSKQMQTCKLNSGIRCPVTFIVAGSGMYLLCMMLLSHCVIVNAWFRNVNLLHSELTQEFNFGAWCIYCCSILQQLHWVSLTGGNWQKWKRVFLTCPCHEIYRDEAVGLKSCKNTWKITIFVKMWNLGQYRENLIFCQ